MSGFMDRWVARLGRRDPTPDDLRDYQAEYDAELKAARADTPPFPTVTVDPFTAKPKCPKCGNAGINTEYHEGVHKDCPNVHLWDPTPAHELLIWGRPSPRVVVARERGREAAVEHLDRRCCNCQYGWTTATIPDARQKDVGFGAPV